MVSRRTRPKLLATVALALALANPRGRPSESADLSPAPGPWPTYRPMAVDVLGGRARFEVPTPRAGSQTLLIVSALSRSKGPFPVRLSARPSTSPSPGRPKPARKSPRRTIELPTIQAPAPAPAAWPLAERTFHLLVRAGDVGLASNYLGVAGRLKAVGRRVQVYVDARDGDAVAPETLRDVVTTFDEKVLPEATSRFGPALDVDRDGRFTVLFSSWLSRLAGGKASVDGFVRGADLDADLGPPFGNRCDMMYLNSGLQAGPHLQTIVAHEYTHAVTFSRKAAARLGGLEEEGWLDEALAHLIEDGHGFSRSNIDYRISAFLSNPERYRLVVDDYYAADLFRSHGNRGATYLFLRWCVDRYGPGLVDALVRSELRGVGNLEAATGSTFADLFREWTEALYLSGLDPASAFEGGYRSIDPRGRVDDWTLAGPRASSVEPDGRPDSWLAEGTSAHFAVVRSEAPGPITVEVDGPAEADLQVTAIALPDDLPRPELTASPDLEGPGGARFGLSERNGSSIRLDVLAWEPLVPPGDRRASTPRRGRLEIASAFGTATLPAGGSLQSRPIPLGDPRPGEAPLIFKAVGTDSKGRKVAAWATLRPSAGPRP